METCNILIVDDDRAVCETLHEFIQISGYRAYKASAAEQAIGIMKKTPIHVVLTDIMLPGMDGLQLTDLIKRKYEADIIVMTGFSRNYSYEDAIRMGASDFIFKPVRFEELLLRLKRVLHDREIAGERAIMVKRLEKLAITDDLTGLFNSRHFYETLKGEIIRADRYGHPLSLLLMDIDSFRDYNDMYGHLEGDKVISKFGKIIKSCLREIDSAYRYGGEEFTVILPETGGGNARMVAKRIRDNIRPLKFYPEPGRPAPPVTASIGITQFVRGETMTDLIQRADKAMYFARKSGRNQVSCLFIPDKS